MLQVDKIVSVYKKLNQYPILNSGKILKDGSIFKIMSSWTQNDLQSGISKTLSITHILGNDGKLISSSIPVLQDKEILYDVTSNQENKRAICVQRSNPDDGKKDSKMNDVLIFQGNGLFKSISLSDFDSHGSVYKQSSIFSSFNWLSDERRIIYLAEMKKPKILSYFQAVPSISKGPVPIIGEKFKLKSSFGEQLTYVENPVVCLLDTVTESVEILDTEKFCPGFSVSSIVAHPSENSILLTCVKKSSFNLGLVYCFQRCCDIFYVSMDPINSKRIGDENKAKMTPRFSPNGKFIVWLENDVNGPHMQCQRLMLYDLVKDETNELVPIVKNSQNSEDFQGIFSLGLTANCWSADSGFVYITSQHRCQTVILQINILTKHVLVLKVSQDSVSLLDITDQFLLLEVSSLSTFPYLVIANVPEILRVGKLTWQPITPVYSLENVDWTIITHTPAVSHSRYGNITYESIFIKPRDKEKSSLILCLHGGPHSAWTSDYYAFCAGAVELGYSCLLVNYRGSWGFGQDCIESLLGFIGEIDVADCIQATEEVLSKYDSLDGTVFLVGGSHGGFLATHLAAKYKKRTKAMVCRNPVINIVSMLATTDIPDWTLTESGYNWTDPPEVTEEVIKKMWIKSPLCHATNIKCPVLILIGEQDKRVPPSQGLQLFHTLSSMSVRTEIYSYPNDSHPLSSVDASSDCFVHIFKWFTEAIDSN